MTVHKSDTASFGDISAAEAFAAIEPPLRDWIGEDGLVRTVAGPPEWSEIAFISMCSRRGSGTGLNVNEAGLEADGTILLAGQGEYAGSDAAVFARFAVPAAGRYNCAVRLQRVHPQFVSGCMLRLDQTALGSVSPNPAQSSVHTYSVELAAGPHRFNVTQPTGDIKFFSLKIFTAPILTVG